MPRVLVPLCVLALLAPQAWLAEGDATQHATADPLAEALATPVDDTNPTGAAPQASRNQQTSNTDTHEAPRPRFTRRVNQSAPG